MPFSENIKLEVKRNAAFRCCRCQSIGVEVHHIQPESDGGINEIDNAAPLCAKCHADFGDNPLKRKEIAQMRDWWYEQVVASFATRKDVAPLEEKIDKLVLETAKNNGALDELKATLKEYINLQIDKITPASSTATSSMIVNTSFKQAIP